MSGSGRGLDLRQEIDRLIASGDTEAAFRRLADLGQMESTLATASFLLARYEKLRNARNFTPHRLAILRSFTLEPVIPLLRAAAYAWDIDLTVQLGDFNAYPQEILDGSSSLYSFKPDTVILAVQTRDIAPELQNTFADLEPGAVAQSIERVTAPFEAWIRAFRERSQANLIVHTLELPASPSLGILDAQSASGQAAAIRRINDNLRRICHEARGVCLLDYDALTARHGRLQWHDEKKWLTARMPISADHLLHMAREWLRFLVPLSGRAAKSLVVDLDNTLWGGVIGEDGINGIRLGAEYPGAAYQALQRALLDLHRKGILLAACSKNNSEDAMEALEKHPGMLLKPEHFAAMRINWQDKAQNLREIAAELNLGIDALAFLDDNPAERERVRSALPSVTVIQIPSDPSGFAAAVRDCPVFERLSLSSEDRERTVLYATERQRARAEQSFASKEDFFRFLEQEAEIVLVDSSTLARVSQLTQKTNQFNLTTKRYGEQQIAELAAHPAWRITAIRVRDRFGDHGLVGVAITHDEGDLCEIDTFLLSCRVIGRDVETALLSHLAESARSRRKAALRGWFLPTRKNAPAKEFYARHGFQLQTQQGDASLWTIDLSRSQVRCPEWIKVRVLAGERS